MQRLTGSRVCRYAPVTMSTLTGLHINKILELVNDYKLEHYAGESLLTPRQVINEIEARMKNKGFTMEEAAADIRRAVEYVKVKTEGGDAKAREWLKSKRRPYTAAARVEERAAAEAGRTSSTKH